MRRRLTNRLPSDQRCAREQREIAHGCASERAARRPEDQRRRKDSRQMRAQTVRANVLENQELERQEPDRRCAYQARRERQKDPSSPSQAPRSGRRHPEGSEEDGAVDQQSWRAHGQTEPVRPTAGQNVVTITGWAASRDVAPLQRGHEEVEGNRRADCGQDADAPDVRLRAPKHHSGKPQRSHTRRVSRSPAGRGSSESAGGIEQLRSSSRTTSHQSATCP